MRSATYRLEDLERLTINLGFVGENEHRMFRFDSTSAFEEYPNAIPVLTVAPPHGDPYPVVITRNNEFVEWVITDSDLAYDGHGEAQLTFVQDTVVMKTYKFGTKIDGSIAPTGEAPEPLDNFITQAEVILQEVDEAIPTGGTTGQVLAKKSDEDHDLEWVDQSGGGGGTSNYNDLDNKPQIGGVTLFGNKTLHELGIASESAIPDVSGFYTKPQTGIPSSDMSSGVQTSLEKAESAYQKPNSGIPASDIESGVIPDVSGFYTKPQTGIPASDIAEGVIPDVSGFYTKPSGGIPSSDMSSAVQSSLGKADSAYQKPSSGIPANDLASGVIPDVSGFYTKPSGGIPSTDMAESVQTSLGNADSAYQKPVNGIPASDLESGVIPSVPVQDVQVNGTSILNQGVANIPHGSTSDFGLIKLDQYGGLQVGSNGALKTNPASNSQLKEGTNSARPIVPSTQDTSVFYALAKLAGVDLANVLDVTVGVFPNDAMVAIQKMLGVYQSPWELINEVTTTEDLTELKFETDSYGEPFELEELIATFDAPASTTGARDSFYGLISFYNTENGTTATTSFPSLQYPNATSTMCAKIHIRKYNGAPPFMMVVVGASEGNSQNAQTMPKIRSDIGAINMFKIYQSGSTKSLIPSGSVAKLYGRRKWTP